MPERRMFSKKITDTDAFLDMPASTQNLYFHFAMHADDDGFIGNPKRIMAMVGASEDDKKVLLMKRFILLFDTGVIVIKHWKIHNLIQSDRYHETTYLQEKSRLKLNEYKAYTEADGDKTIPVSTAKKSCIQNGYKLETEISIGKDSIVEDSIGYLQVSKKEEKENNNYNTTRAGAREGVKSYDEIFEEMYVSELVKDAVIEFIRHLQVNGITIINSRLEMILVNLDIRYGNDDTAKVQEIREAIKCGYKRLPCEGNGA